MRLTIETQLPIENNDVDRSASGAPHASVQFDRDVLRSRVAELAAQGVFIGTSSWKYAGWCGSLYDRARYEYRGRFAQTRFNRDCIAEYAEVFKTVCVDAAYYTFPKEKYLQSLSQQVPEDFQFAFKATDTVTIKRFPNLERFADLAGKPNEHFLDAELFVSSFLRPCETIRPKIGLLMFEFSRFWAADYAHGREFVTELDRFLARLPKGWPYGIEMRNRAWLKAEYFECLARHQVAHVFNSWHAMPPVSEQMAIEHSRTYPDLVAARFLLKPGRKYEEAVKAFQPYDSVKEVNVEARAAGKQLIAEGKAAGPKRRTFIFVNNRLEGHALSTIAAMVEGTVGAAPQP
jgi:uncharacterized protein YecE (DUF72 family)